MATGACEPGTVVFAAEAPSALTALGAEDANRLATGKGVVVAVVDSGIDAGNPHLAGVVVGGVNLVGDGERADGLSDLTGHGTAIAGQIAAQPVSGSGVVGFAPDARLLSVRAFRSDSPQDVDKGGARAPSASPTASTGRPTTARTSSTSRRHRRRTRLRCAGR